MEDKMDPPAVKDMMKGAADPLTSSFHLGYNMLLNLMRVEETSPEYLMTRSFHQFQINRSAVRKPTSIFPHIHPYGHPISHPSIHIATHLYHIHPLFLSISTQKNT